MGNNHNKGATKELESALSMNLLMVEGDSDDEDFFSVAGSKEGKDFKKKNKPNKNKALNFLEDTYGQPQESDFLDFDVSREIDAETDIGLDINTKGSDKANKSLKKKFKSHNQNKQTLRSFNKILLQEINIAEEKEKKKDKTEEESSRDGDVEYEYDYEVKDLKNLFLNGNLNIINSLLWEDSGVKGGDKEEKIATKGKGTNNKRIREHNWLKLIKQDLNQEKDDENFNYSVLEKDLEEAYKKLKSKQSGQNVQKKKKKLKEEGILQLYKNLNEEQKDKLKALKEQSKFMILRIKQRVKELQKEKKLRLRNSKKSVKNSKIHKNKSQAKRKTIAGGGAGVKIQTKSLMTKTRKSLQVSLNKVKAGTTTAASTVRLQRNRVLSDGTDMPFSVTSGKTKSKLGGRLTRLKVKYEMDEETRNLEIEIRELINLKRLIKSEIYFPGLLKWKVKNNIGKGLYIGAKDIEIALIKASYELSTLPNDSRFKGPGGKVICVDVKNLVCRLGILELSLKGSNKLSKTFSGLVSSTINKLYLILKGNFKLYIRYKPEVQDYEVLTDMSVFKFKIQKEIKKGVNKIRLPTSLINILGSNVIPKIIANFFTTLMPKTLPSFDTQLQHSIVTILKNYGFEEEEVLQRMLPKSTPVLVSNLTKVNIKGRIEIEGDLDFNVWRAPLIAPTAFAIAARKALNIKSIEEAVKLDILLRSTYAHKIGFSNKNSVSIEKLAKWRYRLGSYSLPKLKTILALLTKAASSELKSKNSTLSVEELYSIFERVEKLSTKPINIQTTVDDMIVNINGYELYKNIVQYAFKRRISYATTNHEILNIFEDIQDGYKKVLKFVKLRGETSGFLSFLSHGPSVPLPLSSNEALNTIPASERFGGSLVKFENVEITTTLNTFNEVQEFAKENRKKLKLSLEVIKRQETNEFVMKLRCRDKIRTEKSKNLPKMPKRPNQKESFNSLTLGSRQSSIENLSISECEISLKGLNMNLFPSNSTFGSVEIKSDLLQIYSDHEFLNSILDDGRYAPNETELKASLSKIYTKIKPDSSIPRLTEIVSDGEENKVELPSFDDHGGALFLKKQGANFIKLYEVGGMKTRDIMKKSEILIRWLDGSLKYSNVDATENNRLVSVLNTPSIVDPQAQGVDRDKYELKRKVNILDNLPELLQDFKKEFKIQVHKLPFRISSAGENLVLNLSKEQEKKKQTKTEEDEETEIDFSIKFKFRVSLQELLSRE